MTVLSAVFGRGLLVWSSEPRRSGHHRHLGEMCWVVVDAPTMVACNPRCCTGVSAVASQLAD
jgi:hypothetical protein